LIQLGRTAPLIARYAVVILDIETLDILELR